jgi:oligopeptide transport system permease protein
VRRFLGVAVGRFLVSLWLATFLFFAMVHILPGDPVRALFGFRPPPPDEYARLRDHYGLDDPWVVQYLKYQWNLLHGDLGLSLRGAEVGTLLRDAAPVSAVLVGIGLLMQLIIGVIAGVIGALSRRSFLPVLIRVATVGMMSVPIVVVATSTKWVYVHLPLDYRRAGDASVVVVALGVLAVSSAHIAYVGRLAQVRLRELDGEPFIATPKAMGHTRWRVVSRHALKPALPVILSLTAANISTFLTGLIFVEAALELDGLGALAFSSVRERDYAVIVGVLIIATVASLVASFVADVAGAMLDPRIRE